MVKRTRIRLEPQKPVGKKPRGKKQTIRARIRADDEAPDESKGDSEIGGSNRSFLTRFRKGDGRKRPGRPKGSKNIATLVLEAANAQIEVTIEGKKRKISKAQSAAIQLANAGAMGNPKLLLKFIDLIAAIEARAEAARPAEYPFSDADKAVIQETYKRLRPYDERADD